MKREIMFHKNGTGYSLRTGGSQVKLTLTESLDLVEQLLSELPLADGMKTAWDFSTRLHAQIIEYKKAESGKITSYFRATIVHFNDRRRPDNEQRRFWKSPVAASRDEAVDLARAEFGDHLNSMEFLIDTVSVMAAKKQSDEQKLEQFLRDRGLTMQELTKLIQQGDI